MESQYCLEDFYGQGVVLMKAFILDEIQGISTSDIGYCILLGLVLKGNIQKTIYVFFVSFDTLAFLKGEKT